MPRSRNFQHTMMACYMGYITQAIANNLAPLLFLTFQRQYGIPLSQIAMLASINFGIQLAVDFIAAKYVDKIGYRTCMVAAHIFNVMGIAGLAVFPELLPDPFAGLIVSVFFYAVGGGLCEVLVSPIAEACPTEKKDAQMSLLHSFYCWGVVAVVALSTAYFAVFGIEKWKFLAFFWAIVPFVNIFNFAVVPINSVTGDEEGMSIGQLFRSKLFWLLALLMVCSGASELSMSQWASAYTESALNVTKAVGDMAGPCLFAILMGCSRMFYAKFSEKVDLTKFMLLSGALCVACYLMASLSGNPALGLLGCGLCGLSVGIMWPGTFSVATASMKNGGTAMFALLALAGDAGGSLGPALVGAVSDMAGNLKMGVLAAMVFPVLLIAGLIVLRKNYWGGNKA
ncbi:MAG: MFS transporter [Clostridia bacterium]|nr:MFS transporter [Clostridia bacterium]